jgi:hypothetical protein
LPAIQSFKITELKPEQDYFTLVAKQSVNISAAQKLFEGLLRKMNIADEKAVLEEKQTLSSLDFNDYSEYKVTQSSGS